MRRVISFAAACFAIACTANVAPTPSAATTAEITEADLRQRLFLIAHDSMMGRETGRRWSSMAADYVASEFRRLGLEPAGDSGTYFQRVPFYIVRADPASRLGVQASTGERDLRPFVDFLPVSFTAMPVSLSSSPVVFAGTVSDTATLVAPDSVVGKVMVLYVTPGTSPRAVAAVANRYRGMLATLRVQLDQVGPETVARYRDGRPVPDTSRNPRANPTVFITAAAFRAIFDVDMPRPGTLGRPLTGRFDFVGSATPYPARNVVAILRGSDPALRNQYVSLSAHNDHVGFDHTPVDHDSLRAFNRVMRPMGADSPVRQPDAGQSARIRAILDSLRKVHTPRLDSVRNGADDDGSGTVSILEIAEKLASGPRPRRSVLFVSHTGEEDGLVGSRWYGDHSTVPIDSIVAEIDQDMIGRGLPTDMPRAGGTVAATPTYLEVVGARRLSREFGDSVEAANARQPLPFQFDYTYDAPGHPLQYYCRADHYSYARHGVPSLAMSRGEHLDYHQVTDEPQYIDYPDLARVSRMVYTATQSLANMSHRPALDRPRPPLDAPCVQ